MSTCRGLYRTTLPAGVPITISRHQRLGQGGFSPLHPCIACLGRCAQGTETEDVEKVQVVAVQRLRMKKPQKKLQRNSLSILALMASEYNRGLVRTKLFLSTRPKKLT